MLITAISTQQASTKLTITTNEIVDLEQMDMGGAIRLNRGQNDIVVGPGVFKVASTQPIEVVADTCDSVILTNKTKDGDGPDPSLLKIADEQRARFREFFSDARSEHVE